MKHIALISTGGTIEKTYDELSGLLANRVSVLDIMLASLQLHGVKIDRVPLMNKDSLDMSDADHDLIATTAAEQAANHDGVVIVHGTDRLAKTGHRIFDRLCPPLLLGEGLGVRVSEDLSRDMKVDRRSPSPLPSPRGRAGEPLRVPIVLTGAMRPWEMRSTDAVQNLTEALLAVQVLSPGVYVAMHNQVLQFPGVEKEPKLGTFVKA